MGNTSLDEKKALLKKWLKVSENQVGMHNYSKRFKNKVYRYSYYVFRVYTKELSRFGWEHGDKVVVYINVAKPYYVLIENISLKEKIQMLEKKK